MFFLRFAFFVFSLVNLVLASSQKPQFSPPPRELYNITYSFAAGHGVALDLYLPKSIPPGGIPTVIYFHPGGLTSGNRKDLFFPTILKDLSISHGFAFVAADYRLLPTSDSHDELHDIKALFRFLSPSGGLRFHLPHHVFLDMHRVAVSGFSAGAYIARLAGVHITPQVKAILLGYGLGGDLFSNRMLAIPPDVADFGVTFDLIQDLVEHDTVESKPRSDVPMSLDADGNLQDSLGAAWAYSAWWQQQGTFLDYITGVDGFSRQFQSIPYEDRGTRAAGTGQKSLFPELMYSSDFPPTFLFHGENDTSVVPYESIKTYDQLKALGVKTELVLVPNADHVLWHPGKGAAGGVQQPLSDEVHTQGFNFIAQELV